MGEGKVEGCRTDCGTVAIQPPFLRVRESTGGEGEGKEADWHLVEDGDIVSSCVYPLLFYGRGFYLTDDDALVCELLIPLRGRARMIRPRRSISPFSGSSGSHQYYLAH